MNYYVNVSYKGNLDESKDKIIKNLDLQNNTGSGFCLMTKRRDFSFLYKSSDECKEKVKYFRKIIKENKIKVKVESFSI